MTRPTSPAFAQRLGRHIAIARAEAKLSQGHVARELATSTATVSRWESGDASPTVEILAQLAKLLGTTPNDLLGV